MALAELASGSQATSGTTEHSLTTQTGGKTCVLVLDLNPVAAGVTPDILEVRINTKVLSGSTARLAYFATFVGGLLATKNKYSIPVPANRSFEATIKMVQGSNRTIDWAVLSLD